MPPRELDGHFRVEARFYEFRGKSATYPCRDLLEIHRRRTGSAFEADAVFIMMNPGKSKPVEDVDSAELRDAKLVPTMPDSTQYQLMRLMGMQGWTRVKVLNLSDLRESASQKFFKRAREFEDREGHDGHSVFSATRRAELTSALCRRTAAPVVVAWGVNRALRALATNALRALSEVPFLGFRHEMGEWAFRHPLPRNALAQERWRNDIVARLQGGEQLSDHRTLRQQHGVCYVGTSQIS